MKYTMILMILLALGALLLTGCQESESSQIQRARIVANENLQLKEQLDEKDQQIADLKKEIERIETEAAKKVETTGETIINSMRILLESEKQNEALRLENETLKKELEKK